MNNLKPKQIRCDTTGAWFDVVHMRKDDPRCQGRGCTRGGGEIRIDTSTLMEHCMACGDSWPIENPIFHCPCGQTHRTQYSDAGAVVRATRGVLVSDGKRAFVATQTDVAAAGQRSYHNVRVK